jgi:hypothetical protein
VPAPVTGRAHHPGLPALPDLIVPIGEFIIPLFID